jgi:Gluconate 2-dehydrogenase subunit 3
MNSINRREAIKKVALLFGGTLAMPNVLKAWESPEVLNIGFFSGPDADLLAEIADVIIPTTDTPGAKAAGVGPFIVKMVADCWKKEDMLVFKTGLDLFEADCKAKYGKSFADCNNDQRTEALKVAEADKENKFFKSVKDLTVMGYFTSEIGCTQALRYEPVPGRYDGAYPYKKGDKAWAT